MKDSATFHLGGREGGRIAAPQSSEGVNYVGVAGGRAPPGDGGRGRSGGEEALREYTTRFGDCMLGEPLYLTPSVLTNALEELPGDARSRLERIADRIRTFAQVQLAALGGVLRSSADDPLRTRRMIDEANRFLEGRVGIDPAHLLGKLLTTAQQRPDLAETLVSQIRLGRLEGDQLDRAIVLAVL